MELVLIGLNHKTAPVEIRERIAFLNEHIPDALQSLCQEYDLRESMIVSTCNRVEILAQGKQNQAQAIESVKDFLYTYHRLRRPLLEKYLYKYHRHDLIRHVFRVASSLDSMVVGEPQILAQIKEAYSVAKQARSVGQQLNYLIPRAFFVAKKVRTSTRIGSSAVSVSSVAVELARKIFGELEKKTVLLLGAGEMAELAARNLLDSGVNEILIANRTPERSQELAVKFKGKSINFNHLGEHLVHSDIVIVSTASKSHLFEKPLLEEVIRKRKYNPLFLIDIAVPRNVDPQVNEIENVFLYDIDDLQSVIASNLQERHQEAEIAEEIIDEEVSKYMKRMTMRRVGPIVGALRQRIEEMCLEELEASRDGLSSDEYERAQKVMRKTAHKIAHPLIMQIKEQDENPTRRLYKIEIIKKIFRLDDEL